MDVAARVTEEKGSALTLEERRILEERLAAVDAWLESYAPERARIEIRRDALPPEAAALGEDQRVLLGALARAAEEAPPRPATRGRRCSSRLPRRQRSRAGRAFGALYLAFLGRTNGPRAGWLLASLEPGFVVDRLRAAAGWRDLPAGEQGGTGGTAGRDTTEAVG